MPKKPKKANKIIEKLHNLVDLLRYYMYTEDSESQFKEIVLEPAQEIEDYIRDISLDQRIDHIRLIKKWEALQKRKQEKESDEEE